MWNIHSFPLSQDIGLTSNDFVRPTIRDEAMPNTPVDIHMLAKTLQKHLDECGEANRITAETLTRMSGKLELLAGKFATVDALVRWTRRAAGVIVLAVISAATAQLVQNYMLHQQTKAATDQAAAQVSNTTSAAVSQATGQQQIIIQKLDALSRHK
jgi:hypothetical protein